MNARQLVQGWSTTGPFRGPVHVVHPGPQSRGPVGTAAKNATSPNTRRVVHPHPLDHQTPHPKNTAIPRVVRWSTLVPLRGRAGHPIPAPAHPAVGPHRTGPTATGRLAGLARRNDPVSTHPTKEHPMSSTQLATVTPTRTAEIIGRAIFDGVEARTGVTWDGVPEGFRKMYVGYGSRVEAALYAHRIVPGALPRMVPPRLAVEIEEWRAWWASGRVESRRPGRAAAQILADLAGSLR